MLNTTRCRPTPWSTDDDQRLTLAYRSRSTRSLQSIAKELGRTLHAVKQRATRLGLTTPHHTKRWTPEEERFLEYHSGTIRLPQLAKRLQRSPASVTKKCQALRLRTRHHEGYTLSDLASCFGVSERTVKHWITEGKLEGTTRGTNRPHDAWAISEEAILTFIQEHPLGFRLSTVDQLWFLDLLFDNRIIQRALNTLRQQDSASNHA